MRLWSVLSNQVSTKSEAVPWTVAIGGAESDARQSTPWLFSCSAESAQVVQSTQEPTDLGSWCWSDFSTGKVFAEQRGPFQFSRCQVACETIYSKTILLRTGPSHDKKLVVLQRRAIRGQHGIVIRACYSSSRVLR